MASLLKKTLRATERDRDDVLRRRRWWLRKRRLLDSTRMIFLDETAVTTKMVRLMGRGPKGERVVGTAPQGSWETLTLIAGLRHNGISAPFVFKGAIDGPTFLGYVEECLAPTLKRGDVVLFDNLPAHKVDGVREAIEATGASLFYLPPYSPEFNPIEQTFSKLKSHLRTAAERTVKDLCRRIGKILNGLGKQECMNYFNNAGYASR